MNAQPKSGTMTVYAPRGAGGSVPGGNTSDGGLISVASGATSQVVTFNASYTSKPAISAELLSPTGATSIATKIDYSTLTTGSVTVRFSAIPASGWFLSWQSTGS